MVKYFKALSLFIVISFVACKPSTNDANDRLVQARAFYEAKMYDEAKISLDSISILYPKAVEERKAGLLLLDSIRRGDDTRIIELSDSLLFVNQPVIDSMKSLFVFRKDTEYQTLGYYFPKETYTAAGLSYTILRSAVAENGKMYLESVFLGAQRHDRIIVKVNGEEVLTSGIVTSDGLNYTFSNMGQTFEVIRIEGEDDKGIAKLIADNTARNINVDIQGKHKTSYALSKPMKEAIGKSYRLSQAMLYSDSLKTKKEQSEFNLRYLDNREEVHKINEQLRENGEKLKNVDALN